ncbi:uncharacterized protein [Choristoneura fumiferana]|uniref:uncharacterized protein n=1 Tax=Choristoneura fumiferana TaxID=7141 RepID=UPI003D154ADE
MSSSGRQRDCEDNFEECYNGGGSNLHLTEGLIKKFTGQDETYSAERWAEEIDDNAEIFGWTPVQQLLMARRSLAGTALLWFRSERTFKTWAELKVAIIKEFPDKIDQKTIHEIMSTRHRKSNESCLDYLLIMKELGKRGKMADYVAIKYIVEGIKDDELNKIMLYGVTTYSDLKEKLKIYEQLKQNTLRVNKEIRSKREDSTNQRVSRCYSCGEMDHASAECPHKEKGLKCFKCNDFGHIAPNCKMSLKETAGTSGGNSIAKTATKGGVGSIEKNWHNTSGAPKKSFYGCTNCSHCPSKMTDCCLTTDVTTKPADIMNVSSNRSFSVKKPTKEIKVFYATVQALIDSGSDLNLISEDCYHTLGTPQLYKSEIILTGFGANEVKCYGQLKFGLEIDGQWYDDVLFHVVPKDAMPYSMILGQEFLQHCVVLMKNNDVTLKPICNVKRLTPRKEIEKETYITKIEALEEEKRILQEEIKKLKEEQQAFTSAKKSAKNELKEDHEIYELLDQKIKESNMLNREDYRKTTKKDNRKHCHRRKESTTYNENDLVEVTRTQSQAGINRKSEYLDPYQMPKPKKKLMTIGTQNISISHST